MFQCSSSAVWYDGMNFPIIVSSRPLPLPFPPPQATLRQFFIPCVLAVYLGIVLQGYSVKEFNGLVTNRYFLLGRVGRNAEGPRDREVQCVWKSVFPATSMQCLRRRHFRSIECIFPLSTVPPLPPSPSPFPLSSGFRDVEALKKALVANLRDSAIWGLTYLYVRRFCNPEFRPKMATFVQDGYFGALAVGREGWREGGREGREGRS